MFRTAEAAGWTPEARYKTSLYSMLGRGGQSEKRGRPCGAGARTRVVGVRENKVKSRRRGRPLHAVLAGPRAAIAPHAQNVRSSVRYWMASAMCFGAIAG